MAVGLLRVLKKPLKKKKEKAEVNPSTATYSNIKIPVPQRGLFITSCLFTGMEVTIRTRSAPKYTGVEIGPHGSGAKRVCNGCKTHIPALPELYESPLSPSGRRLWWRSDQ